MDHILSACLEAKLVAFNFYTKGNCVCNVCITRKDTYFYFRLSCVMLYDPIISVICTG